MNLKISPSSPLAGRLREARLKKGVSQKKLGVLAGIEEFSASARVNQYERGKHMPDYLTSTKLAKVLGVSVSYFFAEDDQMAEVILLFGQLDNSNKKLILQKLKEILCEDLEF